MAIHNLEPYLSEHAFFSGLNPEYIEFMAGCAKNVVFESGMYLFKQGDGAEWFYVLREGVVAIEVPAIRGGSVRISTVGTDEILGWSWLLPPNIYQFDARALAKTRALALDGKCLRQKCDEDTDLGYEMMKRFSKVMTERLQETRLQLLDVYGQPKDRSHSNER
jgi:CRP-like cAMP-binding protein